MVSESPKMRGQVPARYAQLGSGVNITHVSFVRQGSTQQQDCLTASSVQPVSTVEKVLQVVRAVIHPQKWQ